MNTEEKTRVRRRSMEALAECEVPTKVVKALEDQLTDEVVKRLIAYADYKTRRRYWQGILGGELPEGNEAGDLVAQAVERVLDGRRKWDPGKDPDLLEYLKSVIDSLASNLVKGWANRHMRTDAALTPPRERERGRGVFDDFHGERNDPEEELLQKERIQQADDFLWPLLEDLDDDLLLQQMVECIVDGVTKPAEIAEKVGVKKKEVNNAKKRLKKRIEKFKAARQHA